MDTSYTELHRRWHTAFRPFESDPFTLDVIWTDLAQRYTEPQRAYHNLHHITRMIATADRLAHLATDYTSVLLAILFHDVIYEPDHAFNEENSVVYADNAMQQLGIGTAQRAYVGSLIMATKLSTPATADINEHIVRDADLETLGLPFDLFLAYNQAIARESKQPATAATFHGRIHIMEGFLARDQIFQTFDMALTHEAQARRNISRQLHHLRTAVAALPAMPATQPAPAILATQGM